jgi:hypothetical protein
MDWAILFLIVYLGTAQILAEPQKQCVSPLTIKVRCGIIFSFPHKLGDGYVFDDARALTLALQHK